MLEMTAIDDTFCHSPTPGTCSSKATLVGKRAGLDSMALIHISISWFRRKGSDAGILMEKMGILSLGSTMEVREEPVLADEAGV